MLLIFQKQSFVTIIYKNVYPERFTSLDYSSIEPILFASSREKAELEIHEWPDEGSKVPLLRLVRRKLPHRKKTKKKKEVAVTSGHGWLLLFSNHLLVNG